MKWWEGKKTWPFIQSHAAHGKLRRRTRQMRRRWWQTRRHLAANSMALTANQTPLTSNSTDFDSFLRRNETLMHNSAWSLTSHTDPTLTSDVMYITPNSLHIHDYAKLGHTPHYYSSFMNIHDDSATSDVTSFEGCDVKQQNNASLIFTIMQIKPPTHTFSNDYATSTWPLTPKVTPDPYEYSSILSIDYVIPIV